LKANQAGKGKTHPEKYISSEDVQSLKGSPKDCKMNEARCEETLRTDQSFSLFPLQKKIVT